jgi:Tol biopolymer transport system component
MPLPFAGLGPIAFASNRDGNYDIYVISASGGEAFDLTGDWPSHERGPAWQPFASPGG